MRLSVTIFAIYIANIVTDNNSVKDKEILRQSSVFIIILLVVFYFHGADIGQQGYLFAVSSGNYFRVWTQ